MTTEEAIKLGESKWWVGMPARDVAIFQMHAELLCMPFDIFHKAVTDALGRPVFTHEFGLNHDGLIKELLGESPAPTTEDIINMIPADKRLIVIA